MSTLAPSQVPFPSTDATAPVLVQPRKRHSIFVPLPKMWIGMAIAFNCLLFQLADIEGLVLLTSMLGSCYWLFCVYRIHKILAQYTARAYPVSPRRAIGFQFIPIFEYFWFFRWTRRMAAFVDSESGIPGMPKVWPGMLLTVTSLFGIWPSFKSVRLFLIFGFGIYLTRKLRAILPAPKQMHLKRWQQWNLSMSAGVGAAFSFVLVQAVRHFSAEQSTEKLHDLAAIFLVSIGVLVFLEPLFEKLREILGVSEHHPALQSHKPWLLRLGVFVILALTSAFHGLLHSEIEGAIKGDLPGVLTMLFAALLVAGGVTYFWIGASHCHPSHAARSGLVSGTVLGFIVAFAMFVALTPANIYAESSSEKTIPEKVAHYAMPWAPSRITQDFANGNLNGNSSLTQLGVMALPWALFGFAGGFAIDKRWGNGRAERVVFSMIGAALLCGVALWATGRMASLGEVMSHLSVVAGWGIALIVCSSSAILIPPQLPDSSVMPLNNASAKS
jgi:hypothetical protein